MSIQRARAGRMEALSKRSTDRILVKPARHRSNVHFPDQGTVAAYLIEALGHGSTIEQFEIETGWSRSTVMVNLYKVAKKSGVGIERKNERLTLLLPQGSGDIFPPKRVINPDPRPMPPPPQVVNAR